MLSNVETFVIIDFVILIWPHENDEEEDETKTRRRRLLDEIKYIRPAFPKPFFSEDPYF